MKISAFMTPDDIIVGLSANSKNKCSKTLSVKPLSLEGLDDRQVLDQLLERKDWAAPVSATALPSPIHAKRPQAFHHACGPLAVLDRAIDFEANDGIDVDALLMLAPDGSGGEHLALALASR